jgi:hypothetical protein
MLKGKVTSMTITVKKAGWTIFDRETGAELARVEASTEDEAFDQFRRSDESGAAFFAVRDRDDMRTLQEKAAYVHAHGRCCLCGPGGDDKHPCCYDHGTLA